MEHLSPELLAEVMESAHPSLGFSFLTRWHIPEMYCEIARDHHLIDFDTSRTPLAIVRLANFAGAKVGLSLTPQPDIILSALPEAACLNAKEILVAELEIMMEDTMGCAVPS